MRLVTPLAAAAVLALSLAACTRSDDPHVAAAGQDLKEAGAATGAAADHLGDAAADNARQAARDAEHATAKAQVKTGVALERAGRNLKADARD